MTYDEITREIEKLDFTGEQMCIEARQIRVKLSALNLNIGILYQRKWALEAQLIPAEKYKYYAPKKGEASKKNKEIDWEAGFAKLSDEQKEKLIESLMKGD
jgi:hypothetical protein